MTYGDLRAVGSIENASFGSPWRPSSYSRAVGDANQHFFVVERDGAVVGYGGFWVEGRSARIAKLAVHPDHVRRGIGSALLRHLLDAIRCIGLSEVRLEVRRSNLAAQKLYCRFGFRLDRVQPHAYPNNREDALVFVRDDLLDVPTPTPTP